MKLGRVGWRDRDNFGPRARSLHLELSPMEKTVFATVGKQFGTGGGDTSRNTWAGL